MTNEFGTISIKGKTVRGRYATNLVEVFYHAEGIVHSHAEANGILGEYQDVFPWARTELIDELYPKAVWDENRNYRRYPCAMGLAPPDKVRLNLYYQDTRLKLGLEAWAERTRHNPSMEFIAHQIIEIYGVLLRTSVHGGDSMWRIATDGDLDALTFMLLNRFDPSAADVLLTEGHVANNHSSAALDQLMRRTELELKDFIPYVINSGVVWWGDPPPHMVASTSPAVNDFEVFATEALESAGCLLYLFDDNGEVVWDLMLARYLLRLNPSLEIVAVVSTEVVANNANLQTVHACLQYPQLQELLSHPHFRIFPERNIRTAIDPCFCSRSLLDLMLASDIVMVKGVSFFETLQALEVPRYYAFVVHSLDSQRCTGLAKGSGVFVRVPSTRAGFEYGRVHLMDLYPEFRSEYDEEIHGPVGGFRNDPQ